MAIYMGKAPLTLVRTQHGSVEYVYAGHPAPQGVDPVDLERLLDEGFLVEVPTEEDVAAFVVEDPLVDAGVVDPPVGTPGEPPAKAAAKDAWVEYAIARGADEEWARADATTKQLLIDQYGA